MPKLPPPSHPPPAERPLFDLITDGASREDNRPIAIALGLGLFSGGIFWLLWALR